MKIKIIKTLVILLLISSINLAQDFGSSKLIVVAEDLNLRENYGTNSKIIDQLDHSELLEFIEEHRIDRNWIKVKRIKNDEIGYVFRQFVTPANSAYLNYQDCFRISETNWYGIFIKDEQLFMEKVTPIIREEGEFAYITSESEKYKIFISSITPLSEGKIDGKFYDLLWRDKENLIIIGSDMKLYQSGNTSYHVRCAGNYKHNDFGLTRENEQIYIVRLTYEITRREYKIQEITSSFEGFGEIGYKLHFSGDLNGDNVPDLIISEGTSHGGIFYYFLSNENGEIELQSKTYISSKC